MPSVQLMILVPSFFVGVPGSCKQTLMLYSNGPCDITRTISEITYEIKDGETLKTKIVHVDHFKQLST